MITRKKTTLILMISVLALFVCLPLLFWLNQTVFEFSALREAGVWFFQRIYFNILPGLLAILVCVFLYERIEHGEKKASRRDYFWIGFWIVMLLVFVWAYTASADSILIAQDPFLSFLKSPDRRIMKLGPRLDSLVLSNAFLLLILATIFLFATMQRFHIDRNKGGALLINMLIAILFAMLLLTDFFHSIEENVVSLLYQSQRNPGTETIPDLQFGGEALNYCTPPERRSQIEEKLTFQNDVVRLAHERGKADLVTVRFPRIPAPPGVRDDIEIIGITTADIEAVNFQWPLDWEIYGNLARKMGSYENSILVYDINFMDIKGISGGSKCEDRDDGFQCTPWPGQELRNQTDYLSQSIAKNLNQVLADYPINTSTEDRNKLKNYEQRLAILNRKATVQQIKNGRYAIIRATLPVPPIVPASKYLNGMGHANVFIDDITHLNRRVPLLIRVVNYEKRYDPDYDPDKHDFYYPGIALATALSYYGVDPTKDVQADYLAGTLTIKNIPPKSFKKVDFEQGGLVDVDIMAHPNADRTVTIPMDRAGMMDINFRGGLYCFPYKPILEVAYDWDRRERIRSKIQVQEARRIASMAPRDFADYVAAKLPDLIEKRHNTIAILDQSYKAATPAELELLPYYKSLFERLKNAQKTPDRLAIAREVQQKDPTLYALLVRSSIRNYSTKEKESLRFDEETTLKSRYENKISLVAMYYATGVDTAKDVHLSPYGTMAGIEHQAYAINTILNQDFSHQASNGLNLLILLVIAIIIGVFQPRLSTIMSFVLSFLIALVFIALTVYVSFGVYSLIHVFPTVIIEQFIILISFIGFRVFAEEENVKYIRNTFSKFVSQDVVDELLTNPEALKLGGAKKEVSVFFSDVRGFTTISEKLGPEELVQLLNEYLSVMTDLIIEYSGTIDKYMGDAIMAFWGAPVENDDHAYYTCVCAIAQYAALQDLQKIWTERGVPAIDIGIGINTGPAVVGNMGSKARMDYTLMGDTVNLGSRLEGITKQYGVKIVISEYTYERVKERVYARELDLVRVKGKLEPVRIYELMGLKDDQDLEALRKPETHV
ncbi:MAG: CHASE2 domain-containing protein [Leptospiraceae bacterium]|nr:CHASE2 domain-containing protein [Leptospiraceae bacterium]